MNQPKHQNPLLSAIPRWLLLMGLLLALSAAPALAQTRKITGKVTDDSGNPVAGASVREKDSRRGVATDGEGKFSLNIKGRTTLVITAIGIETQEIAVDNESNVSISVKRKDNALSEVVVTALGIKREKAQLTYSTQQIKGDDITASKETGILNSLTGKVSGLQITSSSGQPGASSRIVLRGNSSLQGNNEALIVLDGVPINNSQTGNAGGGNGQSRLSDIDPSTIESINVLKGSAASALYGSEAARGVLVVTTKGGAYNRKPQVTFNTQYSIETPHLPQMQGKYALGDSSKFYYDGEKNKTSLVWGPPIDSLVRVGLVTYNKNPMEAFFVKGHTFTNTISVSGGNDKANYFFSYSNLDQTGTVPTTKYRRNALFAKFTNRLNDKLTTNLQVGLTLGGTHTIPEGYDLTDPLWTVYTSPYTWNPLPYLDSVGNQRVFRASRNNPYWNLYNVYNNEKITRVIPVLTVTYKANEWLTFTERAGADTYSERADYYEAPSTALITTGVITQRSSYYMQFNNDLIGQARQKFGDFDVDFLLGANIKTTFSQSHSLTGTGISILNFDNVSNGAVLTGSESYSQVRKIGAYAQANVGWNNLLNLSLTGRYDGSSKLNLDKYMYPYGSASLGFIFSNLSALKSLSFLNFGKLRVSYSAVGNDNVGAYANTTPFVSAGSFPYGGQSGFLQSTTLGNPNLINETTKEKEVGVEMNMFHNRINLEASYFDRHHENLLTQNVPLAPATGYNSTTLNAADMTNKGFEALLTVSPFKGKKFGWEITLNYTRIRNNVTRIYGNTQQLQIGQTWAFVGKPYGVFYNIGYARDSATHQVLVDNSGLPMLTSGNIVIGNLQPDFLAGMNNSLYYGNFTMSFFFDYRKGGDILNSDDRYGYFYGTPKVTENRADFVVPGLVNSTKLPNTKVIKAEAYYQRINTIYESVMQDGTYLKLRNLSLGYKLPANLLGKSPFSAASLTLTGRNLWIWAPHFTGSDPEVSSYGTGNDAQGVYGNTVPTSRSYNVTLNVVFK